MIGNSHFHRRSDAQSLVNAAEIIVHEMESDCVLVIINLLAERIC